MMRFFLIVSDSKEVVSCGCAVMHETAMLADCMAMPYTGARAACD